MSSFKRTTITNLRAEIQDVNLALIQSGSDYRYKEQGRNGYHAVDLMRVESDGKWHTVSNMDCNETPRRLIDRLNEEYEFYLGRKFNG